MLFVLAIASTGFASAAPENSVRFAWVRGRGAELCPQEATIAKIVAARLGRDPFSPESSWFIEGVVEHSAAGWSAHIRMSKDGANLGTRELSSETADCSAITAASVLAIAVGIDPEAALTSAPAPTITEIPKPNTEVTLPKPTSTLVRPTQPLRIEPFPRLSASSRGVIGIGLLPSIAPGFLLAAGFEGRVWEGTLGMLWLPEVSTTNRDFVFGITAVSLGACVRPVQSKRLSLAGCGEFYAGGIHEAVTQSQTLLPLDVRQRRWFAAAPSIRARFPLVSWLSVDAGVEFVIPLLRHEFAAVGQRDPVFSLGPLGLVTFLGPTLSIP